MSEWNTNNPFEEFDSERKLIPRPSYDDLYGMGHGLRRLIDRGEEMDAGKSETWSSIAAPLSNVFGRTLRAMDDGAPESELQSAKVGIDEKLFEQIDLAFKKGLPFCESAIEKSLFPWLLTQEYQCFDYNPAVLLAGESALYVPKTVAVVPQLPIGRYRADFALAASRGGPIRFVVVECDGGAFHDGVKEVMKDVDREVKILANPRVLDVVRLSGKDIFKDPKAAALKASKALTDAWAVTNRAMDVKFGRQK